MEQDTGGLIEGFAAMMTAIAAWTTPATTELTQPMAGAEVIELRVGEASWPLRGYEVASVQAVVSNQTQMANLNVSLTQPASARLAELTGTHVGEQMEISVCGTVVTSPVIQTPITGGSFVITGPSSYEETIALAEVIAGEMTCDAFLAAGGPDAR